MGCLFAIFAGFFPRIGLLVVWFARPNLFSAAFQNLILPALGLVFLPFTTLLYVVMWSPGVGVAGWDYVWLVLALLLDLSSYGGTGYANRERFVRRHPVTDE